MASHSKSEWQSGMWFQTLRLYPVCQNFFKSLEIQYTLKFPLSYDIQKLLYFEIAENVYQLLK